MHVRNHKLLVHVHDFVHDSKHAVMYKRDVGHVFYAHNIFLVVATKIKLNVCVFIASSAFHNSITFVGST